jgi:hypothetical protein
MPGWAHGERGWPGHSAAREDMMWRAYTGMAVAGLLAAVFSRADRHARRRRSPLGRPGSSYLSKEGDGGRSARPHLLGRTFGRGGRSARVGLLGDLPRVAGDFAHDVVEAVSRDDLLDVGPFVAGYDGERG